MFKHFLEDDMKNENEVIDLVEALKEQSGGKSLPVVGIRKIGSGRVLSMTALPLWM